MANNAKKNTADDPLGHHDELIEEKPEQPQFTNPENADKPSGSVQETESLSSKPYFLSFFSHKTIKKNKKNKADPKLYSNDEEPVFSSVEEMLNYNQEKFIREMELQKQREEAEEEEAENAPRLNLSRRKTDRAYYRESNFKKKEPKIKKEHLRALTKLHLFEMILELQEQLDSANEEIEKMNQWYSAGIVKKDNE